MTRTTSVRRTRTSKKRPHYRPRIVNIQELRSKPAPSVTPRVIYVQNPHYKQMECGNKIVEARPNYPCLRDVTPGTLVEFSNRISGRSFLATITSRRVHRDFATMLRKETIQDCLPDRDPDDLQRAVNVYHSFRHNTYKYIASKHGVVSFRFTHVETNVSKKDDSGWGEYNKNSLCSIFEAVERETPRAHLSSDTSAPLLLGL